jgi:hypothetical protein
VSVKLELKGLAELRQALRQLPENLNDEASAIVQSHAEDAQRRIVNAYAEGPTGNLRRGVVKDHYKSRFTSSAIVRSRAKHAWMYENGTQSRRTSKGANRGRMPQAPEQNRMIPIVVRKRRQMVEALKDLVRRAGFQVD